MKFENKTKMTQKSKKASKNRYENEQNMDTIDKFYDINDTVSDTTSKKHRKDTRRRKRCTGKRSDGKACGNWAAAGSDKCRQRHNGGAATKQTGKNNPNYKNFTWSRHLPEELLERALEAWNYPDLFHVREEIVYRKMRLGELASKLHRGGKPLDLWFEFQRLNDKRDDLIAQLFKIQEEELNLLREFHSADEKEQKKISKTLARVTNERNKLRDEIVNFTLKIKEAIKIASDDRNIENEIEKMIDAVAPLIKQHTKIEIMRKQYVKVEEMALLFQVLYQGIAACLPESNELVNPITVRNKLISHICFTFNLPPPDKRGYRAKKKALVIDAAPNMTEIENIKVGLMKAVEDGSIQDDEDEEAYEYDLA